MSERRFTDQHDTPCPFRLARFGYRQTGEFRAPRDGELYIQPTEGPDLQEHEPVILGACQDHKYGEPRHIVEALPEELQVAMGNPAVMLISALLGTDPLEVIKQMGADREG